MELKEISMKDSEVFFTREEEEEIPKCTIIEPLTEIQGRLTDSRFHPKDEQEVTKMGYNPQQAKEQPTLPADTIFTAVITKIDDGFVKDFVKGDITKWKNPSEPAIDVNMEVMHNEKKYEFSVIFTYTLEGEQTIFSPRSNLGKFKTKYGKLAEVGDQVKAMTNKDGFLKLVLE